MPVPLSPFVGREREIAAIRALLFDPSVRLLTLTGPGGVGKTRLALRVASDAAAAFADGAAFVDLAPIRRPDHVAPVIGQTLGIRGEPRQTAMEALRAALRDRHLLLILDNFEHLTPAAALTTELLMTCPRLMMLATSRTPLRVAGERLYPTPPLTLPPARAGGAAPSADEIARSDAAALFIQHVQAADPEFRLTDADAGTIAAICRRLDGLPLALELAAARTRIFSTRTLLERLDHRLPLLTSGPRDAPERQRTLGSTIAWSYDLLAPPERALFRRLSVFAGGFTLAAAEHVHATLPMDAVGAQGVDGSPLDLVASLVDQNLLRRENGPDDAPRFTMLETIREYGMERLAERGDEAAAREAHAAYCLTLAERAEPELVGGEQDAWVALLEAEMPNLRVAFNWLRDRGDAARALRLAGALSLFWTLPHLMEEGRAWLEIAVALPGADHAPAPLAKALNAIGVVGHWQGDFARIIAALEQAIALRRDLGDELGEAEAVGNLANALIETGDLDRAEALYAECLPVYRAWDMRYWVVETLLQLGIIVGARGNYDRAADIHAEALALARRLPGQPKVPDALLLLGWTHVLRGDLPGACAAYAEVMTESRSDDDQLRIGRSIRGAAGLAAASGDPQRAARLFAAAAAQRDKERMGLRPTAQAEHDRLLAGVRAALDEATFAAAWASGSAMPLDEAAAEAAALFGGTSSPAPPAAHGLLTRREAEVLRLIVEGRSDKEIATALSIATRTASKHVAAILAKFDVPSRAGAAAIAARDRLV